MSDAGSPDPFHRRPARDWDGGPELGTYVEALRRLLDLVAATNPPAEVLRTTTARFDELAATLEPYRCAEDDLITGRRHDLRGRGNPLLPPFVVDEMTSTAVRATVRFGSFFLGGGGALHGGTLPLLFDDVLGRLANHPDRPMARTAFLHVDYRSVGWLDRDLTLVGEISRAEGRKVFVAGRLLDRETVVAECECLFVVLLPGQP